MPTEKIKPPGYSHDLAVREITSYYQFIEKMYLPPGSVVYPPPEGWPQITVAKAQEFRKNNTVVRLMKHIPYIENPWEDDRLCFARATQPIPYNSLQTRYKGACSKKRWMLEPAIYIKAPRHVLCLANGARDAYYILLDTVRGVVVWGSPTASYPGPKDNPGFNLIPDDIETGNDTISEFLPPDTWMDSSTYPIDVFFEIWKENFRSMRWIPEFAGESICENTNVEFRLEETKIMMKIMVEAGWPGDGSGGGWRREEAEKAMKDAFE